MLKGNDCFAVEEVQMNAHVQANFKKVVKDTSWQLRIFKLFSADSGGIYYIQWMRQAVQLRDDAHRVSNVYRHVVLCNCHPGTFLAPLTICSPDTERVLESECKHIDFIRSVVKWDALEYTRFER